MDWEVERIRCPDGALWYQSWSRISHHGKTKALPSVSSGTGSLDLLTSRVSWFPCSCPHTWLSGSSSFCAGFLRPAFPEEAPSPPTTSFPNWSMKLRCYNASSGSIKDPLQAARHSPAQVDPPQTKGGCISQPFPLMTPLRLQTSLPPPFLSLQWETYVAGASMGLQLANFWMGQGSGFLQRLLITTLSEVVTLTFLSSVAAFVITNHLVFYHLFLKYQ